jgi:hypothetical protein
VAAVVLLLLLLLLLLLVLVLMLVLVLVLVPLLALVLVLALVALVQVLVLALALLLLLVLVLVLVLVPELVLALVQSAATATTTPMITTTTTTTRNCSRMARLCKGALRQRRKLRLPPRQPKRSRPLIRPRRPLCLLWWRTGSTSARCAWTCILTARKSSSAMRAICCARGASRSCRRRYALRAVTRWVMCAIG